MLRFRVFCSAAFIAIALTMALAPAVAAQNATGERVLRSWIVDVKLGDGAEARWTTTVTYNSDTGEYARTVTDEGGELVERTISTSSHAPPTAEEIEMARAVVFGDPELSELFERIDTLILSGGNVLQREAGHLCGPGSRCLQFSLINSDVTTQGANEHRIVVVDVRYGTLVSNNFDASADTNAAGSDVAPAPIH